MRAAVCPRRVVAAFRVSGVATSEEYYAGPAGMGRGDQWYRAERAGDNDVWTDADGHRWARRSRGVPSKRETQHPWGSDLAVPKILLAREFVRFGSSLAGAPCIPQAAQNVVDAWGGHGCCQMPRAAVKDLLRQLARTTVGR